MKPFPAVIFVPLALMLTACSTPDAALQQANHTAALMAGMERELINFRQVRGAADEAQRKLLHERKEVLLVAQQLAGPRVRSRMSAGDTATQALTERMIADADALAAEAAQGASDLAANDREIASIMTPLPVTSAAMTKAQSKVALMGVELSRSTRVAELKSFVADIKENVDANRKKIKDAQDAAKDAAQKATAASAAEVTAAEATAEAAAKPKSNT